MKLWMKKIAAVLITVMTLGTYIPPVHLNTDAEENKEAVTPRTDVRETVSDIQTKDPDLDSLSIDDDLNYDSLSKTGDPSLQQMMEKAKEQTITKMGPRIAGQLEDDFVTTVLPNIESVLQNLVTIDGDGAAYFAISEKPSSGLGERIFHVHDNRANQDVARFHVRREHRPQEGYWFTFHYHTSNDNFETHHEIGELYWDKNVPPKWMT